MVLLVDFFSLHTTSCAPLYEGRIENSVVDLSLGDDIL